MEELNFSKLIKLTEVQLLQDLSSNKYKLSKDDRKKMKFSLVHQLEKGRYGKAYNIALIWAYFLDVNHNESIRFISAITKFIIDSDYGQKTTLFLRRLCEYHLRKQNDYGIVGYRHC